MGREISLFCDYHAQENSLTNHCGILFRLIYRESPQQFEDLVVALLGGESELRVGPVFTQQERGVSTVPDLLIQQAGFSLFFETKIDAWFHENQLQGHIDALATRSGTNVLICLSNFEREDPDAEFAALINRAAKASVLVRFIRFDQLLEQVRTLRLSNMLAETIDEFEQYLDRNELLPRWKYLLDVVNCGKSMEEIAAGAYMCPNLGGPYSHVRARFIGSYQKKAVRSVHVVDALVTCAPQGKQFNMVWKNIDEPDATLIKRAKAMVDKIAPIHIDVLKNVGLQIFLFAAGSPTEFIKDSSGGLLGSKVYFWDIAKTLDAYTAAELAQKLNGRKWSEFGH